MSTWQPIATAPRDWLLLVKGQRHYALAFFNGIYWHDEEMRSLKFKPESWKYVDEHALQPQPLPAPPAAPTDEVQP